MQSTQQLSLITCPFCGKLQSIQEIYDCGDREISGAMKALRNRAKIPE